MFVITGASDGLGLELAKLLLAKGKRPLSLSRRKPPVADIEWIETDLLQEKSIERAVKQLLEHSEPLETLINCAAVASYEDIDKLTSSELERMFKTNVEAPMLLTSKLLTRIIKDEGDIVNVGATIAAKSGNPQQSVYSTTKWALRGFSQNLQMELKSANCRVINFLAGGFHTQMHEKVTGKPIANPDEWMRVEDVARCILQLLELPKNMEASEIILNRKVGV